MHTAGKTISIAVVPTDGSAGNDDFSTYMQQNWRNSFDVAALAEIGDFVSWMTYAQHAGGTTPGPVAGLPWMSDMMDRILALAVAPEKVSLGIPSYSDYWLPTYSEANGARARHSGIPHPLGTRPGFLGWTGRSDSAGESDRNPASARFGSRAGILERQSR